MSSPNSESAPFQTLFDLIGELARRRFQTAERCFATLGLNHTEARLLSLLRKHGGAAAQDVLSNGLSVDRSNAVRAIQRLEREGFVLRRKDDADKRANLVQITPKGAKTVIEISKLKKKMAQKFFGGLQPDEASLIVDLLEKAHTAGPDEMCSHTPGRNP